MNEEASNAGREGPETPVTARLDAARQASRLLAGSFAVISLPFATIEVTDGVIPVVWLCAGLLAAFYAARGWAMGWPRPLQGERVAKADDRLRLLVTALTLALHLPLIVVALMWLAPFPILLVFGTWATVFCSYGLTRWQPFG